MGIFNFFIVIPQIIAAACLGPILRSFFEGQSIFILVLGGTCMILAGLLTLAVKTD
jgi:maltose/moltooligosaccharide transporter